VDPYLCSLVITGLTAALLYRKPRGRLTREGLLGLAYLVAAGLALMLGTRISQEAHDIQAILFGTGVMVRPEDTQLVLAGATLVLGLSLWWRRGIVFASFDPEGARVRGLPVRRLNLALMLAIALMVSISTRSLGALPVFAFSVLPALGAIALAPSPTVALLVAALFGAVAGGGGYLLAFFGQFPVGASQTVVAGALALATIAVGALRR
jgi:zinc transport system permease protein